MGLDLVWDSVCFQCRGGKGWGRGQGHTILGTQAQKRRLPRKEAQRGPPQPNPRALH